jgi:hypothetical protein
VVVGEKLQAVNQDPRIGPQRERFKVADRQRTEDRLTFETDVRFL